MRPSDGILDVNREKEKHYHRNEYHTNKSHLHKPDQYKNNAMRKISGPHVLLIALVLLVRAQTDWRTLTSDVGKLMAKH